MNTQSTDNRPDPSAILLAVLTLAVFVSYFVLVSTASSSVTASGSNGGNDDADSEVAFEIKLLDENTSPQSSLMEQGHLATVEDGRIIYHSAGSSSCPPIIERVSVREIDGDETIVLHPTVYSPDTICTMDIRAFTQAIYREDGEDITEDTEVIVDTSELEAVHGAGDWFEELGKDNRGMKVHISPRI